MPVSSDIEYLLDAREGLALAHPCDLDLLLFFWRHPRTLLTSEHLAACVGYEVQQVGRSLDTLIGAGLVTRSQSRASGARLYVLVSGSPLGERLGSLLKIAATHAGRRGVIEALRLRQSIASPTRARGKVRGLRRARSGEAKDKSGYG